MAVSGAGKHLAFQPLELPELDLADPEQRDFDDYELLECLGRGGMGVVYRAMQRSLQREVAIKLLSAGPWASAEFVARFRREAQNAARLQHPNIVSIHEVGQYAELNFFSMALVRGRNLEQHVAASGTLSSHAAARLVRTLAEALDYAHRLDVLHLDLKPANVLIDEAGEPKIADFGLARRVGESLANDGAEIAGTPGYMAPEQARATVSPIGIAADIHGLGAILYELLCGKPPFVAASPERVLDQLIHVEVGSLRAHDRAIPADLDAICRTCLAKDSARRYRSARELADDLGRFLEGRAVNVRPLGLAQRMLRWARREPRVALAAAATAFAVIAGLVATTVQWQRAEFQTRRAEQTAVQVRESLWRNRGDDSNRLLGEGRLTEALPNLLLNLEEQTATGANEAAARERLRIGSILDEVPRLIDSIALGAAPLSVRLDPRGRWVAVTTSGGEARRYDVDTGTLRWKTQLDVRGWPYLTLAHDGRHLVAPHLGRPGMGASLIDIESGAERVPPAPLAGLFGAEFARDGVHALVGAAPANDGGPRMQLVETSRWRALGPPIPRLPGMVLLAPGGRHYALYARDPDHTISTAPGGCAIDRVCVANAHDGRILWRYRHAPGAPMQSWQFSPDGAYLAVGFGNGEAMLFDAASGRVHRLQPQPTAPVGLIEFGANGAWLGAAYHDGTVQVWNVADRKLVAPPWRIDADGLTGIVLYPEQKLVATHNQQDGNRLWRLPGESRPAIGAQRRPNMAQSVGFGGTDFAPAANLIAAAADDGELRLWRYRDRQPLAARGALLAMPDSRRSIDGRYVLDVRGADLQRLRLADGAPAGVPIRLPQAAGFAQLVPDSDWIVATAGNRIHVRHGGNGRERYGPIELPASPSALLVHPEGRRVVAAWQATDRAQRHLLVLRSIDLGNGRTLAETRLVGPVYRMQVADSGDALLAWRYGELHVFELDSLRERFPTFRFGADVAAFWQDHEVEDGERTITLLHELQADAVLVSDARIGRDGRVLWIATAPAGGAGDRLHAIDARTGGTLREWPLPASARGLQPYEGGAAAAVVLPGPRELRLYRLEGEPRVVKLGSSEFFHPPRLALDRDERRLAVRIGRGVRWFDTARGDWLTATVGMPPSFELPHGPIDLGMDAGGEQVVVGTSDATLWAFAARPDLRPLADLRREIALIAPQEASSSSSGFLPPREPAIRARLRSADPGPPGGEAAAVPDRATEAAIDAGEADPRFVDLRPHCNLPPEELRRIDVGALLPAGRHRLLGIEFEIRCAVIAQQAWNRRPDVASGSRVEGIAVRMENAAAIELLAFGAGRLKGERRETYAVFEFDYADGSRARVSIRNRDQMQAWFGVHLAGDASPLRIAWAGLGSQEWNNMPALTTPSLYAVRVENPHPGRRLRSLALESVPAPWSMPVLLAATLVPLSDATPAKAPATAR
jgi:hypothetical protein